MKRRNLPTRKQRAVRRALWALVVLLAVNQIFGVGLLFPIQAIRQTEEHEGVYPHGSVVARQWNPELRWNKLVYLTANENAVSLGDASLELFGWFPGFGCAVDCTTGEPLHAAARFMDRDERLMAYYFGRVDDPEIVSIAISAQRERYEAGEFVREEVYRLTAAEDELLTHRGKRYFLVKQVKDKADWAEENILFWEVQGYDRNGNLLYRQDIDRWTGYSY